MKTQKIIKNAIRCKHCGDVIESKHVHDFKFCKCGAVAVDGGLDYCKRSFKNSPDDFEELSEFEEIEVPDLVRLEVCPICHKKVEFLLDDSDNDYIYCEFCDLEFHGSKGGMTKKELASEWNSYKNHEKEIAKKFVDKLKEQYAKYDMAAYEHLKRNKIFSVELDAKVEVCDEIIKMLEKEMFSM